MPLSLSQDPPSDRSSRVDDAYGRLKADILSNTLPAGHQASEPEFAARLGMSRTPVREALLRLQSDGLVALVPRRGARVLPVNAEDMREIYDILSALEPEAAAQVAARRLGPRDLAPVDAAVANMEAALQSGDLDAWARADDAFHRHLLRLNGNKRLEIIVSALLDQTHRARVVTLKLRKPPRKSTREHRKILACLRAGDAEKARQVFGDHRRRAARELLEILETYGLPPL